MKDKKLSKGGRNGEVWGGRVSGEGRGSQGGGWVS